jgi:hypothetical protein
MPNTTLSPHLALIDEATLTPLVQLALDRPASVVLTWTCETLHGGMGTGSAVYRFAGQARDQGETAPWSLILKVLWADPSRADPAHPEWWCREVEAYRSNTVESLPAGFSAPRCFAVVEQPGEGYWLWLEEVTDSVGSVWPLEHYGVVARLLGQFNGKYVTGTPLPQWPWLSQDWLRKTVELTAPALQKLHENRHHPLVRRWLNEAMQEETLALWQERERFLTLLDQLPQTLCHFDAFRRNLFTSSDSAGTTRLMAVDWTYTGQGALGVEINCLTVVGIAFFDVELAQAQALDEIVFAGYLAGLDDVGWRGDARQVRLAYTAAAIRYVLGTLGPVLDIFLNEQDHARMVQAMGRPMEAIADHFGVVYAWLFAQLAEARRLQQILA